MGTEDISQFSLAKGTYLKENCSYPVTSRSGTKYGGIFFIYDRLR